MIFMQFIEKLLLNSFPLNFYSKDYVANPFFRRWFCSTNHKDIGIFSSNIEVSNLYYDIKKLYYDFILLYDWIILTFAVCVVLYWCCYLLNQLIPEFFLEAFAEENYDCFNSLPENSNVNHLVFLSVCDIIFFCFIIYSTYKIVRYIFVGVTFLFFNYVSDFRNVFYKLMFLIKILLFIVFVLIITFLSFIFFSTNFIFIPCSYELEGSFFTIFFAFYYLYIVPLLKLMFPIKKQAVILYHLVLHFKNYKENIFLKPDIPFGEKLFETKVINKFLYEEYNEHTFKIFSYLLKFSHVFFSYNPLCLNTIHELYVFQKIGYTPSLDDVDCSLYESFLNYSWYLQRNLILACILPSQYFIDNLNFVGTISDSEILDFKDFLEKLYKK